MKKITLIILSILFFANSAQAKLVKYNFDIDTKIVNFTGKDVNAIAINNQIAGPTIEASVGDTLEVTFNNKMDQETSIHWHGVLLPNDQDGVPHLTTKPIAPHSSFKYKYDITHSGTYWYHSHTGLQEQSGVYGSLVFHPKKGERVKTNRDYVVVLSDWTDENPDQVLANLKKDGDYYALKKGSVQSWDRVFKNGSPAIKNRLKSSWTRMGPMDLSDVGYDAFLANGKIESSLLAKPGETVRIRLINSGASSYFNIEFAGEPMIIVASDGMDVEPIKVKRLRIALAETYDVIVRVPDNKAYELRATSEDGTGKTSVFIGTGEKVLAPDIPKPNLFLVDHSMHDMSGSDMKSNKMVDHSMHNMPVSEKSQPAVIDYMTDYKALRAVMDTTLSTEAPTREVVLNLTGNMERYVWSFNEKTLLEADKIIVKKGEVVSFVLVNKTMMHHPIHLHGHFFRVLNGQGERSPLKHTVNVAPMEKVTIEFEANEEKDWFFHCHNLYHVKGGMARVVSYEKTTTATPETVAKLAHDNWYFSSDISILSNMSMGMLKASNTRNSLELEYDSNYKKEYDAEVIYSRSFTRFFDVYAGVNLEKQDEDKKNESTGVFGVRYMLPMLIGSNLRVNSKGNLRLGLESDIQLTERGKFEWSWNTDKEYYLRLSYDLNKMLLFTVIYDSDLKCGAGIRVKL
jgi:FtsP/CotA-like multicopper oxidase with cupredoxin domain